MSAHAPPVFPAELTASGALDEIALASAFGTPWTFYRCFRGRKNLK